MIDLVFLHIGPTAPNLATQARLMEEEETKPILRIINILNLCLCPSVEKTSFES